MNYKEMIELAQSRGRGTEQAMLKSIDSISNMLCSLVKHDKKAYWCFMRNQHEILYNYHYSPEFAEWDVSKLEWMGKDGQKHSGAHWTIEEIASATKGLTFPNGTTDCDKYVAFNVAYSDFCKDYDETEIIKIAHRFFFDDHDAPEGKVWHYVKAMLYGK